MVDRHACRRGHDVSAISQSNTNCQTTRDLSLLRRYARGAVMVRQPYLNGRLRISVPVEVHSQFREDVAVGLRSAQKVIPPKYFYDAHGSLLFEQICQQPEYYLTRTEAAILREHAADIFTEVGECTIV